MESDIDTARQAAISSGKLTDTLLSGEKMFRAANDDPPFVVKGQPAVGISTSGSDWILIVMVDGKPTAITSKHYNWIHNNKPFSSWKDLQLPKPVEVSDVEIPDTSDADTAIRNSIPKKGTAEHVAGSLKLAGCTIIRSFEEYALTDVVQFRCDVGGDRYEGEVNIPNMAWQVVDDATSELVASGQGTHDLLVWVAAVMAGHDPTL